MDNYTIRPIAYVRSDYNQKFGIPRQAGLVNELEQAIVFEPEFRNVDAVRGLEQFSRIWLIWGFSANTVDMTASPVKWSPTVRPPRLKGNVRKGVWASRSPYRPNSLGLSNVRLVRIMLGGRVLYDAADEAADSDPVRDAGYVGGRAAGGFGAAVTDDRHGLEHEREYEYISDPGSINGETSEELVLIVSGADMLDGTPVFDIKPYIPYSDAHPGASRGYTSVVDELVRVDFPEELLGRIDENKRAGLIRILELDPRGAYEKKEGYRYGLSFGKWDIRFTVEGGTLTVTDVVAAGEDAADGSIRNIK